METVRNILVTGGGAPGAPGIIRAIQRSSEKIKLFSCDIQENTAGKFLTEKSFLVPPGNDLDYIDIVLQICIEYQIDVLFPITTKELLPLSLAKKKFNAIGTQVIVSDFENLQIANDKGKLYNYLAKHKIAVPSFAVANSYSQFTSAESKILETENKYIIKPVVANGSRGFRIIDNNVDENDLLFNHKPNSTYINKAKLHSILKDDNFPPILVSEHLPGQEYTVDCLIQNGKTKLIIPRTREKMNNGISIAGTIENNTEIIEYCQSILDILPLDGPIGIQVKYSKNNTPLIVEINPRIQGTTVACQGAGINIPFLCISKPTSCNKYNDLPIKWGTKFIRHYEELYY